MRLTSLVLTPGPMKSAEPMPKIIESLEAEFRKLLGDTAV